MLEVTVPKREFYDNVSESFITYDERKLVIEHSLLSIEKWEMKWQQPFLDLVEKKKLTTEQLIDYVKCMTINKVDPSIYAQLSYNNIKEILDYMNNRMSATTVSSPKRGRSNRKIPVYTSEVIYAYMIQAGIPFECAKWHINRLLMLLEVCSSLGTTNKRTQKETMEMYSALNSARRSKSGSSG